MSVSVPKSRMQPDTHGTPESRSRHCTWGGNGHPCPDEYPPSPHPERHDYPHHPKCGKWWSGLSTAHCTVCCENFSSVAAFDKHRAGSHTYDTRHCVDPATVRNRKGERVLVDAGRDYPCWGFPAGEKWWGDEDGAS